ncbi:hypothetical protein [Neobacillus vireti]|uniref:hypothetical protein n=1 Tax=Neobacillus vireti TaxID=220686 RepID=UPI002FFEB9A4
MKILNYGLVSPCLYVYRKGNGVLEWRDYLASLQKYDYQGVCTLEIMGTRYYQNPQDAFIKSFEKIKELGIL